MIPANAVQRSKAKSMSSGERGGVVRGGRRLAASIGSSTMSASGVRGHAHPAIDISKNAASTKLCGVICLSGWLSHPVLPRTPSLELSVLPNGGGQIPGLARSMPTVYDMDGAEGDRTPDLCIANAALSQLSYSPAPASVRETFRFVAHSSRQTATAPHSCGAAVTDTNLAGHPTLSTRQTTAREVTRGRFCLEPTPSFARSTLS